MTPVKQRSGQKFRSALSIFKQLSTIRPKEARLTVGMDVGTSAIKLVALGARRGAGAARPVVGQHLLSLTGGAEQLAAHMKEAFAALKLPIREVNLGVSGPWVIMRILELPTMRPAEMKQALPFEAQRYLPFSMEDVTIDGAVLGPSEANKSWVLVVACKKELVERRLDAVKHAGLEASIIDVDALALANAWNTAQSGGGERTRAVADLGAQFTNLVIVKGDAPYLVRDIPWGAEKLVKSIAESSGQDIATLAASLEAGTLGPELATAVKAATEALVAELQLSFDYFENRFGQPPESVSLSGGLALSSPVIDALKSQLTQEVAVWTPLDGLSPRFAVAYGLALRSD